MMVSWRRSAAEEVEAFHAGLGVAASSAPASKLAPHSEQNFALAGLGRLQAGQATGSAVPHWPQNLLPVGASALQAGHCIPHPVVRRATG
jgi:hypothetical protein